MPRNMSFALTTPQFIEHKKDVTRRLGWWNLKPGTELCGVKKAMGLKAGEKIERLGLIRVVKSSPEPLQALLDDPVYGAIEVMREGHPMGCKTARAFVDMLCDHYKVTPDKTFNRIEYVYADTGKGIFK